MAVVKDDQIQLGQVVAFLLVVVMMVGIECQFQLGQVDAIQLKELHTHPTIERGHQ